VISAESLYAALHVPEDERSTAINSAEGEFVATFIGHRALSRTLETGFAYGVSAAFIMSATGAPHYAIDPRPEQYGNLGVANIEKIGLRRLLHLEADFAHNVLPRLLAQRLRFDFAFIDGDHRFDGIFMDFYYVDLLLDQSGYVMLHDVWMPSTQHVISWIRTNKKNYRFIGTPVANLVIAQKLGRDERDWAHFAEFCSHKPGSERGALRLFRR
jgi:predicted O-methyltransferase YrrM